MIKFIENKKNCQSSKNVSKIKKKMAGKIFGNYQKNIKLIKIKI